MNPIHDLNDFEGDIGSVSGPVPTIAPRQPQGVREVDYRPVDDRAGNTPYNGNASSARMISRGTPPPPPVS